MLYGAFLRTGCPNFDGNYYPLMATVMRMTRTVRMVGEQKVRMMLGYAG